MNEEMLLALLLAVAVVAFALSTFAIARTRKRREAARDQLVGLLVERFGDLPAFVQFARSSEGRALMGANDASAAIALRLLWSLLFGAAMLGLGLVLLWLGQPPSAGADPNLVRAAEDYHWWGLVLTPMAAALLAAVAIAAAMARRWGMVGADA